MTEQAPDPANAFENHAPTPVRAKFVRQLGQFSAGLLIAGILVIGLAPFFINQLIDPGTESIMQQLGKTISLK